MTLTLYVNGKEVSLDKPLHLEELLTQLAIKKEHVVIEVNGEIIPRARYAHTAIKTGDRIEIVKFMGGG